MNLTASRTYPLPPEALWPVVADLSGYADHVAGLRSTVATGDHLDATRVCTTTKGETWSEAVTEWVAGERYRVDVDVTTYPFVLRSLFRAFAGTWTVEPVASDSDSQTQSRVTIEFDAQVRRPFGLLARAMAKRSAKDLEAILDSYGRAATPLTT